MRYRFVIDLAPLGEETCGNRGNDGQGSEPDLQRKHGEYHVRHNRDGECRVAHVMRRALPRTSPEASLAAPSARGSELPAAR